MSSKKDKKSNPQVFQEPASDYDKQNKEPDSFSYDAALAEIQQIVSDMQESAIGMDELLSKHERANALIELCQKKLRAIKPKFDISF
ncbi:MAG: Exonuclease small subunit [Bacteroidota bacterium]|jgi:exodeoxyribonuclease VII small subunit